MVGFEYEACSLTVAESVKNSWTFIIDACPEGASKHPNLICVEYASLQPSFVAGYLAGLVTRSKVTGIVGGVPVPNVQKMFNGFSLGVKASCPDCRAEGVHVNSMSKRQQAMMIVS